MDIFKLIFEHDLRLDALRDRHLDRNEPEISSSIEDFMKPDPTYSKFYLSGTVLEEPLFGLNRLGKFESVMDALAESLDEYHVHPGDSSDLREAVERTQIGKPLVLSKKEELSWDIDDLTIDDHSNVGHKKAELAEVLKSGDLVLYKEKAHQGYDLHLFSQKNIYPDLFYPLRELVDEQFRFFSINGKRIRSEDSSISKPGHWTDRHTEPKRFSCIQRFEPVYGVREGRVLSYVSNK